MAGIDAFRERVLQIGRPAAIMEEMLRLGFITEADLKASGVDERTVQISLQELTPTWQQLREAEARLSQLDDLPVLLAEIRTERIAMVKARREEKKAEKARLSIERHDLWEKKKRTEALFLGIGVSSLLIFDDGAPEQLTNLGLPSLSSAADIAEAMGLTTEDLVWLCYERGATTIDHYTRFEIPKRSGGKRLISSPKPKMRKAQSWVNDEVLSKLEPSAHCFAFRPGLSIVDNAKQHTNKKIVFKLDIKDFFPSITFPRVRGYFQSLGYNPGVATILALVCTDAPRVRVTVRGVSSIVAVGERSLPQGACTSPALANLIASQMDNRLAGFVDYLKDDWAYTRYADDLTFSTNNSEANLGPLMTMATRIAKEERFEINKKKTRIMRSPRRQSVTGLIVGSEVRIPKKTIKQIRALFHNIETKGAEVVSGQLGKNSLNVAHGFWSYMHMVDPDLAAHYLNKHPWLSQK
jgi:retron-type reverse transcriptase